MTNIVGTKSQQSLKKSLFTADIGVQTEAPTGEIASASEVVKRRVDLNGGRESSLAASDLASILKWSTEISSDINLSSGKLSAVLQCLAINPRKLQHCND
jgi:hypothetical protein